MNKKDELMATGKEIFIDAWLEFNSDQVINTLRKLLAGVSPDDLRQFVAQGIALPVPSGALDALKGYEDYVELLTPQETFEWLCKARPDLGEVLMSLGEDATAEYLIKLRSFIVGSIKKPEGIPAKGEQTQMVELTCNACGRSWTLPKNLAEQVTVCPFCGQSARGETPEEEPAEQ